MEEDRPQNPSESYRAWHDIYWLHDEYNSIVPGEVVLALEKATTVYYRATVMSKPVGGRIRVRVHQIDGYEDPEKERNLKLFKTRELNGEMIQIPSVIRLQSAKHSNLYHEALESLDNALKTRNQRVRHRVGRESDSDSDDVTDGDDGDDGDFKPSRCKSLNRKSNVHSDRKRNSKRKRYDVNESTNSFNGSNVMHCGPKQKRSKLSVDLELDFDTVSFQYSPRNVPNAPNALNIQSAVSTQIRCGIPLVHSPGGFVPGAQVPRTWTHGLESLDSFYGGNLSPNLSNYPAVNVMNQKDRELRAQREKISDLESRLVGMSAESMQKDKEMERREKETAERVNGWKNAYFQIKYVTLSIAILSYDLCHFVIHFDLSVDRVCHLECVANIEIHDWCPLVSLGVREKYEALQRNMSSMSSQGMPRLNTFNYLSPA